MDARRALLAVLEDARTRGLLGPGPVAGSLDHALDWAAGLGAAPERFLDLGTGGGMPGLALAFAWPAARGVLLDSRRRSVAWVRDAIERLDLGDRLVAVEARAETAGHDPHWREAFPLVVARAFGRPAVTAECASSFVAPGGRLSVSEPPGTDPDRWPARPLADLGLRLDRAATHGGASFVVLEKTGPLAERWPRAVGRPGRRPLWS